MLVPAVSLAVAAATLVWQPCQGAAQAPPAEPPAQSAPDAAPVEQQSAVRGKLASEVNQLWLDGKYDEARARLQELIGIEQRDLGPDSPAALESYNWLARLAWQAGDFAAARTIAQENLPRCVKTLGAEDYRTAETRLLIDTLPVLEAATADDRRRMIDAEREAEKLDDAQRAADAIPLVTEALTLCSKILGPDHPFTAEYLWSLARLRLYSGDLEGVADQFRQVMRVVAARLGQRHPRYINALDFLGRTYEALGDVQQAEVLYRQVIELRRAVLGDSHLHYAVSLNNLAVLLDNQARYADAVPLYREALAAHRRGTEIDDHEVRIAAANLARALVSLENQLLLQSDLDQARPLAEESLRVRTELHGADHWTVADARAQLSLIERLGQLTAERRALAVRALKLDLEGLDHDIAGQADQAIADFEHAIQRLTAVLGDREPALAQVLNHLGNTYFGLEKYRESLDYYQRAEQIARSYLGDQHPFIGVLLSNRANALRLLGDSAAAEPLFQTGLKLEEESLGAETTEYEVDFNNHLGGLGQLYLDLGDYARAEPIFRRVVERLRPQRFLQTETFVRSLHNHGTILRLLNEYGRAEPVLQESIQVSRAAQIDDTPEFAMRLNALAILYDDLGRTADALPLYEQSLDLLRHLTDRMTTDFADLTDNLGQAYVSLGEYGQAEPLLYEALAIRQALTGTTGYDYRLSLSRIGNLHWSWGNLDWAAHAYEEAVQLARQHAGAEAGETAERTKDLGLLYLAQGNADRARQAFETSLAGCRLIAQQAEAPINDVRAAATCAGVLATKLEELQADAPALEAAALHAVLVERQFGHDHWRSVDARLAQQSLADRQRLAPADRARLRDAGKWIDQANDLKAQGRYFDSIQLARQVMDVYVELLGQDHPDTQPHVDRVADLLRLVGGYEAALPLAEQVLAVRERTLGKHHPDYAAALTGLGITLRKMGLYARCEQAYLEALELNHELYGDKHTEYANSLHNLAVLYESTSDMAKALDYARQALDIYAQLTGEDSLDYANVLLTIGGVYFEVEDFTRAVPPFMRHNEILRERLGTSHPDYLESQYNLALLYQEARAYDQAEQMLNEYRDAWLRLVGHNSPQVADALNALGNIRYARGDYPAALDFFREALDIRRQVLGSRNPRTLQMISQVGRTCYHLGRYDEGLPLLEEAVRLREEILPKSHPALAVSRATLADAYYATDRKADAFRQLEAALEEDQYQLENTAAFSGKETLAAFLDAIRYRYNHLLAMTALERADPAAPERALKWVLRRKAVVLDALCNFRAAQQLFELQPAVAGSAGQVRALRSQLAAEAVSPPPGLSADDMAQRRRELEQQLFDAESKLRDALRRLGAGRNPTRPEVANLRKRLPPDAALIEYVRVGLIDFRATSDDKFFLPARYFAFVLRADASAPVQMFDLGDADAIDEQIERMRQFVANTPRRLALDGEEHLEHDYQRDAAALYEQLFAPLRAALGGVRTVYLALEGQLHLLPFASLVDQPGHYLIESLQIATLSTGRDLLREPAAKGTRTLVLAGPNYDLSVEGRVQAWQATEKDGVFEQAASPDLALRSAPPDATRGLRWSALAGATNEAHAVEQALAGSPFGPVELLTGDRALEESLKHVNSPRILHIATHGFFLTQQSTTDSTSEVRGASEDASAGDDTDAERGARGLVRLRSVSNPLLRSGIVLAGANDLDEAGAGGVEDGWVTAEEVSQIDLAGTELVVLSACETGLGDIRGGEGVFGLRRALVHAGAQSVVTSLFSVPDEETQQLMSRFYRYLATGHSKLAALNQAQLDLLHERRERVGAGHPFFWASFIFVGTER
ncbi:MAG: CHAT domain-containing protein [Pirellulales bacterium]|nr:CHAT domain-containing protein [Pirellulales bacterium]